MKYLINHQALPAVSPVVRWRLRPSGQTPHLDLRGYAPIAGRRPLMCLVFPED